MVAPPSPGICARRCRLLPSQYRPVRHRRVQPLPARYPRHHRRRDRHPSIRAPGFIFAALPAIAALYGTRIIDTLHERVGEFAPAEAPGSARSAPSGARTPRRIIAAQQSCSCRPAQLRLAAPMRQPAGAATLPIRRARWRRHFWSRTLLRLTTSSLFQARPRSLSSRGPGRLPRPRRTVLRHRPRRVGDVEHSLQFPRSAGQQRGPDGYSIGGYWTHFGRAAGISTASCRAHGTIFRRSPAASARPTPMASASAASLEGEPDPSRLGLVLEPQAQLIYPNAQHQPRPGHRRGDPLPRR